ncbi:MAG: MotA/TolQ/ExbB proton channel family protein [gamma proteobacterium symbiont of Bathyaustriella thionipta]|nr:MotA/TolQ/ExbB proton channel family protein [gamma proteobacterium symbiont of Bathyaustriella thionipta]MCU7948729.1 MotA/TolQ/ExbB proton channel family protein [gamma proteobacterium symbiont of Bathyaustriella thionipta]MCU7954632.1 MotA/TolQ/ExbB proton channel family protein [gamma proteobacterium symbiont of Bathyaustriella thionipta]MCU7955212.1 MotA/TolQ/ExbB proton channel family protein [gamma proteobacterium symbiont of Bathyaustriella thionipta]MCU7968240.1 MotA/TolQ/ExbB proto
MIVTDIFDKGGIIVSILAGYSFIALTILFERVIRFTFMGRPGRKTEQNLLEALKLRQPEAIIDKMRCPEGRLLQGMLQASKEGIHDLNRVAIRLGSFELNKMEKGFRTLSFLGNTAPLLGLLGTIIGMIKAFMVIEQAGGQVDAQALAGGIWEAMLTTGVGLAVAIPVLLLLHLLESAADKRAHSMRNYASLMIEYIPKDNKSLPTEEDLEATHHRNGVTHAV